MEKIYFKTETTFVSIEHLLYELYTTRKDWIYSWLCCKTYSDPECTIEQCHEARRSFSDLMSIFSVYLPEVKVTELLKKLRSIHINVEEDGFYPIITFCPDIEKFVLEFIILQNSEYDDEKYCLLDSSFSEDNTVDIPYTYKFLNNQIFN